jgi:tetratricopeptide (TPR) repeat protein
MSNSHPVVRHLFDSVPSEMFRTPSGDPAPDLLPELAGHLASSLQRWDAHQRESELRWLAGLGHVLRDLLVDLFYPEADRNSPRLRYLLGIALGLARFADLVPASREDWLAVLPPGPISFDPPGERAEIELADQQPWLRTGRGEWWAVYVQGAEDLNWLNCWLAPSAPLELLERRCTDLALPLTIEAGRCCVQEGRPGDRPLTVPIRLRVRGKGLQPGEVVRLLREAAAALRPYHERGLSHGDLRPSCLVVPEGTPDPRLEVRGAIEAVLVQDHLDRQRRSKRRCILVHEALQGDGSLIYASPQVQRGLPATPADDVHALAVIGLQLFTGDLLAGRPGGSAWRADLLQRNAPPWLLDLLAVCWADRREDRPRDAGEVLAAIDEATAVRELVFLAGPIVEPLATADDCVRRSDSLLNEKKHEEALLYAERAIALAPRKGFPYYQRARCKFDAGDFEAAVGGCTQALRREADRAGVWHLRGAAHLELGAYPEALADFTQAILAKPAQPEATSYAHRAAVLLALKRDDEADADSGEALRLAPDNLLALATRGEVARRRGRTVAAIADCNLVLARDPAHKAARRTRALANAQYGDYHGALNDFAIALVLAPGDLDLLLARARMHLEWRHYSEARADFGTLLAIEPGHGEALAGRSAAQAALDGQT